MMKKYAVAVVARITYKVELVPTLHRNALIRPATEMYDSGHLQAQAGRNTVSA